MNTSLPHHPFKDKKRNRPPTVSQLRLFKLWLGQGSPEARKELADHWLEDTDHGLASALLGAELRGRDSLMELVHENIEVIDEYVVERFRALRRQCSARWLKVRLSSG